MKGQNGNFFQVNLIDKWKEAAQEKSFIFNFIASLFVLAAILHIFSNHLLYIEDRPGALIDDPILANVGPIDLTWYSFGMIYGGILIAVIVMIFHPKNFLIAIKSYSILASLRMLTMFLLPLEAPETIIHLADPVIEQLGTGRGITDDLFFSGHTSTMFMLYLTAPGKFLRAVFLIATVLIGVFVALQHVHYTIDVVAAPFFAFGAYTIGKKLS